jgi:hypothetical protein
MSSQGRVLAITQINPFEQQPGCLESLHVMMGVFVRRDRKMSKFTAHSAKNYVLLAFQLTVVIWSQKMETADVIMAADHVQIINHKPSMISGLAILSDTHDNFMSGSPG